MEEIINKSNQQNYKKKLRIAIYCRVSSREQALYGYGIDVQKTKIKAFISLFDIEAENITYYVDEGISAKDLNRHAAKQMISDIKADMIDAVYIYKLDRLSRSVTDIYEMIEMFIEHECNLVAVMDNIDINSANGRLFVGILAIIAQWERETITERTNDGLEEMARQGKWPYGTTPFGYDKDENLKLSINDDERTIFRSIVGEIKNGKTIKEVENFVLDEYNLILKPEVIKKMLKKEYYYGLVIYKGKYYYDICPAIYTQTEAEEVQKMISKRYKVQYRDTHYYFRNKIHCICGEILDQKSTKKKDKHYFYYECSSCRKRINQNYIIEQSLYSISATVSKKDSQSNTNRALRKLNGLNRKIYDLHNLYVANEININIYLTALYRLEYDKKEQIAKINTSKLIDFMKWEQMTNIERISFINNHIARVIVDTTARIVIKIDYIDEIQK